MINTLFCAECGGHRVLYDDVANDVLRVVVLVHKAGGLSSRVTGLTTGSTASTGYSCVWAISQQN